MNIVNKTLIISLITNFFLSLMKVVFGFIGKSSALIADGIHSFSDLVTDFVSIFGSIFSRKPADAKHPYGHGKYEYLTSSLIGLVIIGLGISVIYSSINKEIVIPSIFVVIISLITIVVKYYLSIFVLKRGKKYDNNILIANGKESSADVLSSIFVIISALLMQLSDKYYLLKYADIVVTSIIGILIIHVGIKILKENISILLDEQITDKKYINRITKIVLSFKEVLKIDKIVILQYGSYYKLALDIVMDSKTQLEDVHNIINLIEEKIKQKEPKIKYIITHVNPNDIK